jgi:WD40 repeat protein
MDAKTGSLGPSLGHEDFISALAISPSGSLLASAAAGTYGESFQPLVYLWDTNNGDLITQIPLEPAVNALRFSPDGRTLAILTSDNILHFFEIPQ